MLFPGMRTGSVGLGIDVADVPNPLTVAFSILKVLLRVRRQTRFGHGSYEWEALGEVLARLEERGPEAIEEFVEPLDHVIAAAAGADPSSLTRSEALAFWINLYNAGALRLAARANDEKAPSVMRLPGAFSEPFVTVGVEALSLDAIEHAKIRRFKDPRVHAAMVCGAISCPTLRTEPYRGSSLDGDLDRQMRHFLDSGGAVVDGDKLELSRVFLWFGADFVRPRRMPTFVPSRPDAIARALAPWLGFDSSSKSVVFQSYDWSLRCSVGPLNRPRG